jgi:hypothetical protein
MKKKLMFILIMLFFSSLSSYSWDYEAETDAWYSYWGVGYAFTFYPTAIQQTVDELNNSENVNHLPLCVDLFGIYLTLPNNSTLAGVIFNLINDRYNNGNYGGQSIQYNHYLISASTQHYFEHIGRGYFVRADLGLAYMTANNPNYSRQSAGSESGWGFLAGAGYAVPIEDGPSVTLSLNYTHKLISSEGYGGLMIGISALL